MTALTADRNTQSRIGNLFVIPAAASKIFYGGALLCVNAAGYGVPGATATGLRGIGRVSRKVASGETAGEELVEYRKRRKHSEPEPEHGEMAIADKAPAHQSMEESTGRSRPMPCQSTLTRLPGDDMDGEPQAKSRIDLLGRCWNKPIHLATSDAFTTIKGGDRLAEIGSTCPTRDGLLDGFETPRMEKAADETGPIVICASSRSRGLAGL